MSSTEVAEHAGVSRSAVSQILNGHTQRFAPGTVTRVLDAARVLDYRPSHAGRSLRRGSSDLVVTLVHERTFGPQLWDFVNALTADLAAVGLNHVLQLVSSGGAGVDAVLGLQPLAVVCTGALPPDDHEAITARGITVVEGAASIRDPLDLAIGALQAAHLARAGYRAIAAVRPPSSTGFLGAEARESGVREWATANGIEVLPTLEVDVLDRGWATHGVAIPAGDVGLACYNDEVALAVVGLAHRGGRAVPHEVGVIGADDSSLARISAPTITTIRLNMSPSRKKLLEVILGEVAPGFDPSLATGPIPDLSVVEGESTRGAITE